ncbi:F/Y rich C-terminus-domain-containing protein [Fennellomyces sp. T-0311]|nr:F/Y rich C-terminus-domain-containing protein [Fennellomyces sp. T-0311]
MASLVPNNPPLFRPPSPTLHAAAESSITEEKYKQLKRKLKEMMEVNESISREYSQAKRKVRLLIMERNVLLDNIAKLGTQQKLPADKSKTGKKPRRSTDPIRRDIATVASAPPKRSKMSRAVTKTRRVQPVDRDEHGNVKLPQQIGVLTVVSLGKIVHDRDAFHNERYIFPVGFTVQRTYPSMINPNSNTSIVSTILDGGDGPRFHVMAADMPDQPIIANSATGAWTVVVRRSNEIRHREHSNSASGPDYYGFKHPTIAKLIQDLPGVEKLRYYVRQNFEEMEPRAAKGVMAAAQKKRGNLEQMGNANVRPASATTKPSPRPTLSPPNRFIQDSAGGLVTPYDSFYPGDPPQSISSLLQPPPPYKHESDYDDGEVDQLDSDTDL